MSMAQLWRDQAKSGRRAICLRPSSPGSPKAWTHATRSRPKLCSARRRVLDNPRSD